MAETPKRFVTLKAEICTVSWDTSVAPSRPFFPKLSYRSALRLGHTVYIPGYTFDNDKFLSAMVIVDIVKNVWRSRTVIGPCHYSGEGFLYEDEILWIGTRNAVGDVDTVAHRMQLSTFDIVLGEWANAETIGRAPSERFGLSAKFVEELDRLIVFGGQTTAGRCLADLHLLDVARKKWVQPLVKGESPRARFRHGSCVHDGVYYCYGGIDNNGRLSDGLFVLKLSVLKNREVATWSKPKLIFIGEPVELSSFPLIPFQGMLLFCGGIGRWSKQPLRVYDPRTGRISKLMPETPHDFGGYGWGTSVVSLEDRRSCGIFGINGNVDSYIRLSVTDPGL